MWEALVILKDVWNPLRLFYLNGLWFLIWMKTGWFERQKSVLGPRNRRMEAAGKDCPFPLDAVGVRITSAQRERTGRNHPEYPDSNVSVFPKPWRRWIGHPAASTRQEGTQRRISAPTYRPTATDLWPGACGEGGHAPHSFYGR